MKALATKIGDYRVCAHDCPEGIWDFPFMIQMNILNSFIQF